LYQEKSGNPALAHCAHREKSLFNWSIKLTRWRQ
jgi:hypothetical protein